MATVRDGSLERVLLDKEPSGSLFPWRRYRFPVDWDAQFENMGPLHLEIGFGDGRYTVQRAKDEPRGRFVGLEISSASLQRALRKVRTQNLNNVRLLKIGANFAVRHLFAPHSLQTVTVNFPDPWPKARHEDNRLLRAPFFELAASRLQPGGKVLLATDHPDYLAFAQTEAQKTDLYTLFETEPPAAVFETKYALKWKSQGKPLHYQVFEYRGGETPLYPPLERDETMPHALLTGSLPATLETFEKRVVPYGRGPRHLARGAAGPERRRGRAPARARDGGRAGFEAGAFGGGEPARGGRANCAARAFRRPRHHQNGARRGSRGDRVVIDVAYRDKGEDQGVLKYRIVRILLKNFDVLKSLWSGAHAWLGNSRDKFVLCLATIQEARLYAENVCCDS